MRFRWNGKRLYKANYCDDHFAHNKEPLFYERQREIIREIENLELEEVINETSNPKHKSDHHCMLNDE